MRIACVDKSAADRLALLETLDRCLTDCRDVIGHVTVFQPFPTSKEEFLINTAPDALLLGPAYSSDEAFLICRDARRAHPNLPILVLVSSEHQSFRVLQRFAAVADDVFAVPQECSRFVHSLCKLAARQRIKARAGKLVVVRGVKGGVGATSIVTGLAHAAQAQDRTALLVDFSAASALSLYLLGTKQTSREYASCLLDATIPDRDAVQRMVAKAPNGLHLLLQPEGGNEIRELWLRNSERFELTLALLDTLAESYGIILVDQSGAEGVLPFALRCRAADCIFVSSDDPAAVHLLGTERTANEQIPGAAQTHIVVNELSHSKLDDNDILDFLAVHDAQSASGAGIDSLELRRIPNDAGGRSWIGTGNSFYTESSRSTQRELEALSAVVLRLPASDQTTLRLGIGSRWRKIAQASRRKRRRDTAQQTVALLMPPSDGPATESGTESAEANGLLATAEASPDQVQLSDFYEPAAIERVNA